jgi:nucleotide-binding universal stress UspA family protein
VGVVTADETIVVGVDDSEDANRAIAWAVAEARLHGDKVVLVHAWQFPAVRVTRYAGDALPVFGREDIEKIAGEVLARAERSAKTVDPTVEVESRLVLGHPGAVLIDASRGARLLVIGSRGLGGFTGMLMGSVSDSCVHHAHCPVMILRPAPGGTR